MLIGNLTRDPELHTLESGATKCTFGIAINRYYKDKAGNKQEDVTFVTIVAWGPQADNCARYLKKGRPVAVEGRLSIRDYLDKEGVRKYVTEIVANNVQFLGGGQQDTKQDSVGDDQISEDEVPF